jgi:hypothetical protein
MQCEHPLSVKYVAHTGRTRCRTCKTDESRIDRANKHEHIIQIDNGCEVSPKCIECPLPACRYDDPRAFKAFLRARRLAAII